MAWNGLHLISILRSILNEWKRNWLDFQWNSNSVSNACFLTVPWTMGLNPTKSKWFFSLSHVHKVVGCFKVPDMIKFAWSNVSMQKKHENIILAAPCMVQHNASARNGRKSKKNTLWLLCSNQAKLLSLRKTYWILSNKKRFIIAC